MIEAAFLLGVLIFTELTIISSMIAMFIRWLKKEAEYISTLIKGISIDTSYTNQDVHKIRDNTYHILRCHERSEKKP